MMFSASPTVVPPEDEPPIPHTPYPRYFAYVGVRNSAR